MTRRHVRRLVAVAAAAASVGATALLAAPNARAAEGDSQPSVGTAASASCSDWVLYQQRACLSLDGAQFSASVEVGPHARGWYGYVSLNDANGTELARTAVQIVRRGESLALPYTAGEDVPEGTYCTIDNRWDPYHGRFYVEAQTCLDYLGSVHIA